MTWSISTGRDTVSRSHRSVGRRGSFWAGWVGGRAQAGDCWSGLGVHGGLDDGSEMSAWEDDFRPENGAFVVKEQMNLIWAWLIVRLAEIRSYWPVDNNILLQAAERMESVYLPYDDDSRLTDDTPSRAGALGARLNKLSEQSWSILRIYIEQSIFLALTYNPFKIKTVPTSY